MLSTFRQAAVCCGFPVFDAIDGRYSQCRSCCDRCPVRLLVRAGARTKLLSNAAGRSVRNVLTQTAVRARAMDYVF